jgi:hypothetical protein
VKKKKSSGLLGTRLKRGIYKILRASKSSQASSSFPMLCLIDIHLSKLFSTTHQHLHDIDRQERTPTPITYHHHRLINLHHASFILVRLLTGVHPHDSSTRTISSDSNSNPYRLPLPLSPCIHGGSTCSTPTVTNYNPYRLLLPLSPSASTRR